MTKAEFIDRLCQGLRTGPSADDISQVVSFYDQAIDDRVEDGMSEEEAVAAMGDVEDIIRDTLESWAAESREARQQSAGDGDGSSSRGEDRWESDGPVTRTVHRTLPSAGVERIELFETSGTVRVRPSSDWDIHLDYAAGDGFTYEVLTGPTLTVRRVGDQKKRKGEKLSFDILGRKLSISVPDLSGIFSGDMDLTVSVPDGLAAELSVHTASGTVKVRELGLAGLDIKTTSGKLCLEDVRVTGRASLVTVSGDAELESVTAEHLSCVTVSGDVEVDRFFGGTLELRTTSGDLNVSCSGPGERLILSSVSGDAQIELSSPCPQVTWEAVSGDMNMELPGGPELYKVTAMSRRGDVDVPWGQGPNSVTLRTMSGDICVETVK